MHLVNGDFARWYAKDTICLENTFNTSLKGLDNIKDDKRNFMETMQDNRRRRRNFLRITQQS
jgi:hypothetical protein